MIALDLATDPLWDILAPRAAALSHGLRASWSNPVLCSNGKVAGTFCIYYSEPRSPTSQDLELIELATHVARVAIERDQQEISLREAQNELAHVSRVTTVGEFAASIAHEVNQPLAGILTNANAALRWLARSSPNLASSTSDQPHHSRWESSWRCDLPHSSTLQKGACSERAGGYQPGHPGKFSR